MDCGHLHDDFNNCPSFKNAPMIRLHRKSVLEVPADCIVNTVEPHYSFWSERERNRVCREIMRAAGPELMETWAKELDNLSPSSCVETPSYGNGTHEAETLPFMCYATRAACHTCPPRTALLGFTGGAAPEQTLSCQILKSQKV